MINNRQAGRRRGRGGQQQRSSGGNPGRGQDTGNRIDNRSRGNAAQLLEKYKTLARESQMHGDRVNTEYYLQFADHYFRVLAETRSRFEDNRQPVQGGANTFQDDEQEYDDEGEPVARAEQQPQRQQNGGDQDRNQDRGQERNQNRNQERGQDRGQNGNDRNQNYAQNGNANGGGSSNSQSANDGQYEDRPQRGNRNGYNDRAGGNGADSNNGGENRYARDDRPERNERGSAERTVRPLIVQPEAPAPQVTVAASAEAPVEAPRRRGRPRRVVEEDAPQIEADRLPPSLSISAIVPDDAGEGAAEEKPKPRRRRATPVETNPVG